MAEELGVPVTVADGLVVGVDTHKDVPGRVPGRPIVRWTRRCASSGDIIGASPAWPGVSRMASGRPRPSTAAWIFVLSPPRERPRA